MCLDVNNSQNQTLETIFGLPLCAAVVGKQKKENVSALLLAADLFCFLSLSFLFCVFFYLSLSWNNHRLVCSLVKNKTKSLSIFVWFLVLLDTVLLPRSVTHVPTRLLSRRSVDHLLYLNRTLRNYSTNFEIYRLCITTTTTTCTAYPKN